MVHGHELSIRGHGGIHCGTSAYAMQGYKGTTGVLAYENTSPTLVCVRRATCAATQRLLTLQILGLRRVGWTRCIVGVVVVDDDDIMGVRELLTLDDRLDEVCSTLVGDDIRDPCP